MGRFVGAARALRGAASPSAAAAWAAMILGLFVGLPTDVAAQICGNDVPEFDEECDDGNAFGGDGCAANCTRERVFRFALRRSGDDSSHSRLQTLSVGFSAMLNGSLTMHLGAERPTTNIDGVFFDVGEIPLAFSREGSGVIASNETCIRLFEAPELGPMNFGAGKVACGDAGLTDLEIVSVVDADVGVPITYVGGVGPRGSAVVDIRLSHTFGSPAGFDGERCTDDDPTQFPALTLRFTTGAAEAIVSNPNGVSTRVLGSGSRLPCPEYECLSGTQCIEGECRYPCLFGACEAGGMGAPIDCDLLAQGDPAAFAHAVLVGAGPLLDLPAPGGPYITPLGDSVQVTTLSFDPLPTATPSLSPTRTRVATVTSTATRTPTVTQTSAPACFGDCDGSGEVTVEEIVRGVNGSDQCPAFAGGETSAQKVVQAVENALGGCSG